MTSPGGEHMQQGTFSVPHTEIAQQKDFWMNLRVSVIILAKLKS